MLQCVNIAANRQYAENIMSQIAGAGVRHRDFGYAAPAYSSSDGARGAQCIPGGFFFYFPPDKKGGCPAPIQDGVHSVDLPRCGVYPTAGDCAAADMSRSSEIVAAYNDACAGSARPAFLAEPANIL